MWPGKKRREEIEVQQAEAEAALEKAQEDQALLAAIEPIVTDKVSIIDRINKENNFALRMQLAYGGKSN